MDRYYFDSHAIKEHGERDNEGDWVLYSDVAALESRLQHADKQATIYKDRIVAMGAELDSAESQLQAAQAESKQHYESAITLGEMVNSCCDDLRKEREMVTRLQQYIDSKGIINHRADQLQAENEALRADCAELIFVKDKYLYLTEALKEMPGVLSQVLAKINSDEFKAKFTEGS